MIKNLESKLSGLEPINKIELIELVNSWGRKNSFSIGDTLIKVSKPMECYDLSKLDVSKIEDYIDPYKFICDIHRIMFAAVPRISSHSCSFSYIHYNENLMYDVANNILKNSINNGFLNKFKEPYIFLIERNNWEKETWLFGLQINKNNINDIVLLKEKLIDFFPNKQFSIGYEVKDLKDIDLDINTGYFNKYNIIDKKINFKSLLKLDKSKLENKLYKGGLLR